MPVIRQTFCFSKRHAEMIKEIADRLQLKASDVIRRAVEDYWQKSIGDQKNVDKDRKEEN